MNELLMHKEQVNEQLARYGVKFGIYKNGVFHERLFPFDPIPRQIGQDDFSLLAKGLRQRVRALN
ncbi:MAG: circularly permuted type 2 ATP-grasp protein, partial [Selenomonadaceae bacterium]|nr:circularly permuted type 2 ATP-grasp protein [Selenomonadaceae bacterium]